jgi:hypothetical protein
MQKVSVLVASKLQLKAPQKSMPATNATIIPDSGWLLMVDSRFCQTATSHTSQRHDQRNV